MTNGIALFVVLLAAAALVADAIFNGWGGSLFLARRFLDLVAWVAFWR